MLITRTPKDVSHPFARIDNDALRNRQLSLKARGLLALILSMDDSWDLSVSGIVALQRVDGEESVRTAWKELVACGYLRQLPRRRDAGGKLLPVRYEVCERPAATPETPHPENPDVVQPHPGLPRLAEPRLANPAQRTTNSKNDQLQRTTKEIELEGGGLSAPPSSDSTRSLRKKTDSQDLFGYPIQEYRTAVDVEMAKNIEVARKRYWPEIDQSVRKHRSFDDTFGSNAVIRWTSEEDGYLREIGGFCAERWPGLNPIDATTWLIRSAFRRGGKAFQLLKYWAEHHGQKLTLRPFLTLAGGGNDPLKREEVLKELAAAIDSHAPAPGREVAVQHG